MSGFPDDEPPTRPVVKIDCPKCEGSGQLPGLIPQAPVKDPKKSTGRYSLIACKLCGGTGKVSAAAAMDWALDLSEPKT